MSYWSASSDSGPFIQELQELLSPDVPHSQHEAVNVFSRSHSPSDSEDFKESSMGRHDPQEEAALTSFYKK